MRGNSGFTERAGEIYLPYIGHVSDGAVLMRDGSVLAMGHIDGVAFELEDPDLRNARCRGFNTLYRNIADDNVSVYVHLVRHDSVPAHPGRPFRSVFGQRLSDAYHERALDGGFFRNDYYITVVVAPRNVLGKFGGRMARRRGPTEDQVATVLHAVEDLWQVTEGALDPYGLRRLGLREKNGVMFTEIGEALRHIITCQWTPVPLVSGSLGASIYTDRVICGRHGFQLASPYQPKIGAIYAFREYPAATRPGMLNTLLSADFPFVLSQSFAFLTRAQAHARLTTKANQMVSSGDKAVTQIADLKRAEDELAGNAFVMGSHHLSLAVYAQGRKELADRGARARARLTEAASTCSSHSESDCISDQLRSISPARWNGSRASRSRLRTEARKGGI
jgi:type IV secretion system protein VirB4